MKTISKRFLVMLAALVVLISSIGILAITSSAEVLTDKTDKLYITASTDVPSVKTGEKFIVTFKMENYAAYYLANGSKNLKTSPDGKIGLLEKLMVYFAYDKTAFTPSPYTTDDESGEITSVTKPLVVSSASAASGAATSITIPGTGNMNFMYQAFGFSLSKSDTLNDGFGLPTTNTNLFQVEFTALSNETFKDYDFTINSSQTIFTQWKTQFKGGYPAVFASYPNGFLNYPIQADSFSMNVANPIDKTVLETAISNANLLLGNATEGFGIDEYYKVDREAFAAAIGLAEDVVADDAATAEDVSTAIIDLAAAELTFTESKITLETVDDDGPIIDVGGNVSVWQNDNVTLTITATDAGCGLATDAYSFDNGLTWQPGKTKMFSANEEVTVQVRDIIGNFTTQVVSITKIDKSLPTITDVTGNSSTWTATKTLTVDAADTISGISKYSFDNEATWQDDDFKVYTANVNGITVKVKDLAGNITTYGTVIDIIKIDGTAPTITDVTSSATGWQNTEVTLTVNATDPALSSGGLQYKFGDDAWQSGNTKVYLTNTAGIIVKVKDSVGNEATYGPVINITEIDTTEPTVSVSVSGNPSIWQNTPVTITVTATDVNGSGGLQYNFGDGWQSGNTKSYAANTSNITIMVKDAAGNEVTYTTVINIENIDTLVPTITSVTENATTWQKTDVTLTVTASDTGGSDIYMYSFDNGATWQAENTEVFSANASVNVKVKDLAGNISTVTVFAITKIDKDGPVVTVAGNPTTWQATNVTLTVNATDAGSGILAVAGYSFDNGETWQDSKDMIFTANKNDIKILVKDNLGNISAVTVVNITMIDKTAPTITVSGNPTAKVKSAVLTIGSSADLSGKTITVSKDGGAAVTITGTTYTVTANGSYLFTITNGAGATQTSTVVVTNISATTPIPATGNDVNNGILALMILLSGAALTIFAKKKGAFRTK